MSLSLVFSSARAHVVELEGVPQGCRDPNDDMFIETARRGEAESVADRDPLDKDMVERLEVDGIRVASIATFLRELRARGVVSGNTVIPKTSDG